MRGRKMLVGSGKRPIVIGRKSDATSERRAEEPERTGSAVMRTAFAAARAIRRDHSSLSWRRGALDRVASMHGMSSVL